MSFLLTQRVPGRIVVFVCDRPARLAERRKTVHCCSMDYDNLPARLFERKMRRARKEYHCVECKERIARGERYEYVRGCWEGEWLTFRSCRICAQIRTDYFCSWVYGELWEGVWECLGPDCFGPDEEE